MRIRMTLALVAALGLVSTSCTDSPAVEGSPSAETSVAPVTAGDTAVTTPSADVPTAVAALSYILVDTGQTTCYDERGAAISCPGEGEGLFGQDGNYSGSEMSYLDNGNGTVTDLATGLMWQQDPGEKMTYAGAVAALERFDLAGYDDWRLPTIKELYSLIDFDGTDPSNCQTAESCDATPFINTYYFDFEYGDTGAGERVIDSQYLSSTRYVSTTMGGDETAFGVNFADGRIKGYGLTDPLGGEKTFFVLFVRGNPDYGVNDFTDNGDGTVSDLATGLMWQQGDGVTDMEWAESLEYCEVLDLGGYDDWRLPDAKELQSIVDYTRSPATTGSAAIDPVFAASTIVDEGGGTNHGFYWTSTTHATRQSGTAAVYVAFGEALGWMQNPQSGEYVLLDVHGAGAQRSDPKSGDADDYPYGHGPQGDVVRVENLARCVRDGSVEITTGGMAANASTGADADSGSVPDGPLAGAAAALGVSEEALVQALGDPNAGPPDLEEASALLGVTEARLREVLPPPPGN